VKRGDYKSKTVANPTAATRILPPLERFCGANPGENAVAGAAVVAAMVRIGGGDTAGGAQGLFCGEIQKAGAAGVACNLRPIIGIMVNTDICILTTPYMIWRAPTPSIWLRQQHVTTSPTTRHRVKQHQIDQMRPHQTGGFMAITNRGPSTKALPKS